MENILNVQHVRSVMENNAITFKRSDEGMIKISEEVISILNRYKQDKEEKLEAGGVLIGRYILDSNDIVIDTVTEPLKHDKQTRYSFYRDRKNHQKIVNGIWKESGERITYLGEWHTHPERYPSPSQIDLKDWKKLIVKTKFFGKSLFFIIVGIDSIRIWEMKKDSKLFPIELFKRAD